MRYKLDIQPPINPPSYWAVDSRLESDLVDNQSILNQVEEIADIANEILEDMKDVSQKDERREFLKKIEEIVKSAIDS